MIKAKDLETQKLSWTIQAWRHESSQNRDAFPAVVRTRGDHQRGLRAMRREKDLTCRCCLSR